MELRLLVWEMATEEQHVVVISNRLTKDPFDPYEFRGFKSLTPAPVTLYGMDQSHSKPSSLKHTKRYKTDSSIQFAANLELSRYQNTT